ncbi:ACP S-malonyltransferase [Actinokineospora sp. G85]|uniref:ACP S-malonyltransferase n=1 Tax=Actinokineospora sp. G85 TaxID=3406626 RepID=UPI003C759DA2
MTERVLDADAGLAFPGQGTKRAVMVAALRRHSGHELVARFLDGADPAALDFDDTAVAQPATYVAGVAGAQAAFGPPGAAPLVLGHSLGELTAAAYAGVVDVRDGYELARRRGELCREHAARRPGAMVAVMGARLDGIEWLRRHALAAVGGVLEIAGLNGRAQTVLSGDHAAVREVVRLAEQDGLKTGVLPIPGGFHSPLMVDLLTEWRSAVEAVPVLAPVCTVVSATDATAHTDPERVRELLVRALVLPVRWREAVRAAQRCGVKRLWEAGPGDTLSMLGKRDKVVEFTALDPVPR